MLLGESEEKFLKMLDFVYNWSKKSKLNFIPRKCNIVHFRKPRSSFKFVPGNSELNIVEQYKYLVIKIK